VTSEEYDPELERLKLKKLRDMLRKGEDQEKSKESFYMKGEVVELTDGNFEEFISKAPLPVVVDFWAAWCGPCIFMEPIFKELAKEMAGKMIFAKVNVDESPSVASRLGIYAIPTMIVFDKGKPIHRITGARPLDVLRGELSRFAKS